MANMTKREKLIYCAGFFDGEGCISLSKPVNTNKKYSTGKTFGGYQLQIIVAQRDRRPIDLLVSLFGGNLHPTKANNGSTYWYWRLANQKALAFLRMISPFLIAKQKASEVAILFQEYLNDTRPHRSQARTSEQIDLLDTLYLAMREMNARNKLMDYTAEAGVSLQ